MTPELTEKLMLQFPVAGVVLAALVIAVQYLNRQHKQYLDRLQAMYREHKEAIVAVGRRFDALDARRATEHEAELARQQKSHAAHVRDLRERVRRLEDRLAPGDRGT